MIEIKDIENKIIHDDCLNILKQLPDNCIDLVLTSPPYDNLRNYGDTLVWSFEVFKKIAKELVRVLKKGGCIVWIVADATIDGSETGTSFKQALYFKQIGLNLHDTMIYQKQNPSPNTSNKTKYQQCFEYMFVFSKSMPKTVNLLLEKRHNETNDKRTFRIKHFNRGVDGDFKEKRFYVIKDVVPRTNIWKYKVGFGNSAKNKIAFEHPAIFPEQLAYDHIVSWSKENDLVLDCFSGSGTTAVVCSELKRRFICIEKNEQYYELSCRRLEEYNRQLKLF